VAAAGEVLATIGEGGSNRLEALILLGGDRRKRVAVGMEAQIMPDGTKREEYGSMRGRVVAVSDGEVSIDHVQQILHNEQLTKRLFGDSSPLMAWVELVPDRNTPSGFAWWSGNGPNYGITPGTVVGANILIEEVRPISLVIPALRKLLSIGG
jgi:HlyD family secretion protein